MPSCFGALQNLNFYYVFNDLLYVQIIILYCDLSDVVIYIVLNRV